MIPPGSYAEKIRRILSEVEKPGRYIGNEVNSVVKDPAQVRLHVALVFPDAYEMGESHVGLKILYQILNDIPHIWAERVYAPLLDMEAALKRHQVPLFSLESRRPLKDFDLVGITLPYELVYTNILTILDRGGIPLLQKDRDKKHPIILGGGTCSFNPEPIAEFFDGIIVGDGEELIQKMVGQILSYKEGDEDKVSLLKRMSQEKGVYIPSFFNVSYLEDGRIEEIKPRFEDYPGVEKATVTNLDQASYPTSPIVPNIGVIHDRIGVEVQRGCVRSCRFCQAGYIYRPERQRSPQTVQKIIRESLKNTGQKEVSLLSLSVGDFEPLNPLLNDLFNKYEKDRVAISLPATRTETLTPEIIKQVKRVRKTGFTIAPEAGTPRMRRIINKGNERSDMMRTVENVFQEGWRLIKFYYMCGLPFEQKEDVLGIAEEARMALKIGKKFTSNPRINVSVSSFVPKPFTPFQWEPQLSIREIDDLHELLGDELRTKGLAFKHHNVKMSYLEGVFSRGDRRLSKALLKAYELGARFDEWKEHLDFELWTEAFRQTDIDPDFYVSRKRVQEEILPWDHLFIQMKKDFLWKELEAAHDEAFIEDCSTHRCTDCGICDFREVKNVNYQYVSETGEVQAYSTRRRILKNEPEQNLPASTAPQVEQKDFKTQTRLRVKYSKLGETAYLSHLDLMTVLRRALSRAKVPIGFSKGFHPHMLLSMGPAQPLGQESISEFLDLELVSPLSPEEFRSRMNPVLPDGIMIQEVWEIEKSSPSINGTIREQAYDIDISSFPGMTWDSETIQRRVQEFNDASEIVIRRKRAKKSKSMDIRPFIKNLKVMADGRLHLVTHFGQESGSVKAAEVVHALFGTGSELFPARRIRKVNSHFTVA